MTTAVDIQSQLAPSRLGQATAVEQSRAVAETQAAVIVAQQVPRDITRAVRDMLRSCGQKSLAERAFFRYSRGGSQITGPSIQLARALASCWGNLQFGLTEMRRDDAYGQSEMQAWAWDLQTNTRSSTTFIVPHRRDTKDGPKTLTDMRDIYESNANNGARRLREMIFAIVPAWFIEDAVAACYETIATDGGSPLAERVKLAIEGYATRKVTAAQLEQKLGAPSAKWTAHDLAQLSVIYRSIQRGEIRVEDEFPVAAARVTAAEITGQQPGQDVSAPVPPGQPAGHEPATGAETQAKPKGQPAPPAAVKRMEAELARLHLGSREDLDALIFWLCPGYSATRSEVKQVTDYLVGWVESAKGDLDAASAGIWDQYRSAHPGDGELPADGEQVAGHG